LAPHTIEASEKQETPLSGRIIKFYEIEDLDPSGEFILRCSARARAAQPRVGYVDFFLHDRG
jgi:hypothetical protein